MKLNGEKLKELIRSQTARSAESRSAECISEEQLIRAASGEMSIDDRRTLALHLIKCSDCTEEYRVVRSLENWVADQKAESAASARQIASTRSRGFFAAVWQRLIWEPIPLRALVVSMFVIVAVTSIIIWQTVGVETPRSTERSRVSLELSVEPADQAQLSEPPRTLKWSVIDQAISYRVAIYDYRSTPVWESARINQTEIEIPETVRSLIEPNQPYYWRVIAEDALEQRHSDLFQFVVVTR